MSQPKQPPDPRRQPVFIVHIEGPTHHGGGTAYAHINFSLGYVQDDELDYYSEWDYQCTGKDRDYYNLRITCQIDSSELRTPTPAYVQRLEYDRSVKSLGDAERIYKTLQRLNKLWNKMENEEGYTKSYGQFVNRWARAIGVKHLYIRKKPRVNALYDRDLMKVYNYIREDLKEIPWWTDNKVQELYREARKMMGHLEEENAA